MRLFTVKLRHCDPQRCGSRERRHERVGPRSPSLRGCSTASPVPAGTQQCGRLGEPDAPLDQVERCRRHAELKDALVQTSHLKRLPDDLEVTEVGPEPVVGLDENERVGSQLSQAMAGQPGAGPDLEGGAARAEFAATDQNAPHLLGVGRARPVVGVSECAEVASPRHSYTPCPAAPPQVEDAARAPLRGPRAPAMQVSDAQRIPLIGGRQPRSARVRRCTRRRGPRRDRSDTPGDPERS